MVTAKRLYNHFLNQQTTFKPDKFDQTIIRYIQIEDWYDIDDAVLQARQVVGR